MQREQRCYLYDLPIELFYEIQIYSRWDALPLTSKRLYNVFKSAPSSVCAEYLVVRYLETVGQPGRTGQPSLVSKALRFPICTQAVLETMLRMPARPPIPAEPPTELARRLFRSLSSRPSGRWSTNDAPLPMLRLLYTHPKIPRPDPNSWEGYALTKASAAGFIPLVRFLLDKGASPRRKAGLAVHAAIRRKDLALVKLLIEPDATVTMEPEGDRNLCTEGASESLLKRPREELSTAKSAKRRRLEDRVVVDQEMLRVAVACDAREIVQYFIQEKSCMPDMQTVRLMRS